MVLPKQTGPPAPFNTASLQQDASRRLSLPVGVVMRMAQTLYEGVELRGERRGLITYMRTDGTQMSQDAVEAVRAYIGATYGAGRETLSQPDGTRVTIEVNGKGFFQHQQGYIDKLNETVPQHPGEWGVSVGDEGLLLRQGPDHVAKVEKTFVDANSLGSTTS